MTKTADVKDLAANFADWLKEVAAGHEVVVTENDRPVARVVSPSMATRETNAPPSTGPDSSDTKSPAPAGELVDWIRANAQQGRPIARKEKTSLEGLPTLPGQWTGEDVIKGETLANEMFDRS